MIRTRRLAAWVGEGRPVTPKGVLRPADVPAAAAALEVVIPARIKTAADVEAIHRPWVAGDALGLISVGANKATAMPGSEGGPLDQWWVAVSAVLRAESHDDRRKGAAVLCRVLLTVLATEPAPAAGDLAEIAYDLLRHLDIDEHSAVFESFRRGIMAFDVGMELLGEIGAVDEQGRITPLGRWLYERMIADKPEVTADLSATDLLAQLAKLPADDDMWQAAATWLYGRDVEKAADELLAAAGSAAPAERVVAVDVVAGIAEQAVPALRRALDHPMLAPHARTLLAEFENPPEPGAADRSWLAVEYAMAALAAEGPQEAYNYLRDVDGLDDITGSGHPDAAALHEALSDLIATGGPPVPTYQMKIALTRVRGPVWRRLRLPATTTLDVLHRLIQIAFDWDDDHLHMFTVDGRRYSDPFFNLDDCADETRARLGKVLPRSVRSMRYVYDMGDWWEHQISVEKIIESDDVGAPTCTGGQGDAPVEDWSPDFDLEPTTPFDIDAINRAFARLDSGDSENSENSEDTGDSEP
jgi:hypothetical protein